MKRTSTTKTKVAVWISATIILSLSFSISFFAQTTRSTILSPVKEVIAGNTSGLGFLISESGYMITPYDVVKGYSVVKVRLSTQQLFDAEVLHTDKKRDIAVIKMARSGNQYYKLADSEDVNITDHVFIPSVSSSDLKPTEITNKLQNFNHYNNPAFIAEGSVEDHGKPILNSNNEVIGIFLAYHQNTPSQTKVVLPINYIKPALERLSILKASPMNVPSSQKMPFDLTFAGSVGLTDEYLFAKIKSIGFDSMGNTYLMDKGFKRLYKYDSVYKQYPQNLDETKKLLKSPADMVISKSDIIYVLDESDIKLFNNEFQLVKSIPFRKITTSKAFTPLSIAVIEEKIYILTREAFIYEINEDGMLLDRFGSYGLNELQFRDPKKILADKNYIYILDEGNARVQILSSDKKFVLFFPIHSEEGTDLTISNGTLYILDYSNNKVKRFNLDGTINDIHPASLTSRFGNPKHIAVSNSDHLYVSYSDENFIMAFDSFGNVIQTMSARGLSVNNFFQPISLTGYTEEITKEKDDHSGSPEIITPESAEKEYIHHLYTLDSNKQIHVTQGNKWLTLGYASMPYYFKSIVFHPAFNEVVASDIIGDQVITLNDQFKNLISFKGKAIGKNSQPVRMDIDSKTNRLYVIDSEMKNVSVYHPNGTFINSFMVKDTEGNAVVPTDIEIITIPGKEEKSKTVSTNDKASKAKDEQYILILSRDKILSYDIDGYKFKKEMAIIGSQSVMGYPKAIESFGGMIFVADYYNNHIHTMSYDGNYYKSFGETGRNPGEFYNPVDLLILDKGELPMLFVLEQKNQRIQYFALDSGEEAKADKAPIVTTL